MSEIAVLEANTSIVLRGNGRLRLVAGVVIDSAWHYSECYFIWPEREVSPP